ncbi:MAG: hypothetical protein QXR30_02160 [Candidatus Woesearchaeota archaeon]
MLKMIHKIYKKSASLWISWTLLAMLLIVTGVFLGNWIINSAKTSVSNFREKVNEAGCNNLWLRTESFCQDLNVFYVTLSNPSLKSVAGFRIMLYDLYGNVITRVITERLPRSTFQKSFRILKDQVVQIVEIIPYYIDEEKNEQTLVYCNNRKIIYNKVPFCDEK